MDKFQSGSIVLLLVFYGIYFGKMLGQKKKGIRTNQIAKGDKAEELMYIEFIMKIATIGVPVYELVSILCGINKASENMRIAGLIIATVGVMIFGLSVYTMRDSWRAGIPESDRTKMVSEGIYSISRNPAFCGFDLTYIGILLMFFNIPLLVFTCFAIFTLHLQILQEEKYLEKVFGIEYREYRRKVFRYLGRNCRAE
ncbi:methyltransferase family protein [Blautia producta]|uniref:methyltransferase family protein n=1 Tax=Blautia producta TaxID=33035 RepID=UPI003568F403